MSRSGYHATRAANQLRAKYPDICARCGDFIAVGEAIMRHQHGWMHLTCASGQDDE